RKYRTTYAIVLVLAMIIGTNTAFGETIGSCHKREKMLCKKRDITSLWKELSDELSELKEEMVNIKETVNGLKKDELGELKQEILDIKETVNDLKKGELGELKEEMVDTKETLNELKKDILGTKNQIRVGPHMDCSEDKNFTGARIIQPHGQKAFRVYCSGGCVYIARRFDGSVDFYRGWAEYQRGFGSPGGEYFIGLDNLHGLLNQSKYSLTVELTTWPPQSETRHAKYSVFDVSDESDNYRLTIGSYSGTAGNSLSWHTAIRKPPHSIPSQALAARYHLERKRHITVF
ncbi:unnamed protein product, partial [Owenia fusiformis]